MSDVRLESELGISKRYYGKYPGVVINNAVEGTRHTGRIKVRVPSILEEGDGGATRPIEVVARPCLPPGYFFVPDDQSHVWVEFAAGDVDAPVWVGVWYPDGTTPLTTYGSGPSQRQKVFRSAAGHVVTLDDESQSITIGHRQGTKIAIDKDGHVSIEAGGKDVNVLAGSLSVDSGDIQLGGGRNRLVVFDDAGMLLEAIVNHTHPQNPVDPQDNPPKPCIGEAPARGLASGVLLPQMIRSAKATTVSEVGSLADSVGSDV